MIQSIQRAVAIMRLFSESEPELGVIEIGRRLSLHKSTVSRILATLQAEGLVQQNPETAKYSLGAGLVSLAGVALGQLNVRGIALPVMEELARETQETTCLIAREGNDGVCIAEIPAPRSIRYVTWLGRRTPLHCTANGKVILAHDMAHGATPPAELNAFTPHTETDPARLDHQLSAVVQNGYATERDEFIEGTTAVAAPVFDHQRRMVAALAIAGPTFRMEDELVAGFVPQLLDSVRAISIQLGYRESIPKMS